MIPVLKPFFFKDRLIAYQNGATQPGCICQLNNLTGACAALAMQRQP